MFQDKKIQRNKVKTIFFRSDNCDKMNVTVQDKKIQRNVCSDNCDNCDKMNVTVQDKKIQRKVHSEPGPVFQDKKIQRNSLGFVRA